MVGSAQGPHLYCLQQLTPRPLGCQGCVYACSELGDPGMVRVADSSWGLSGQVHIGPQGA